MDTVLIILQIVSMIAIIFAIFVVKTKSDNTPEQLDKSITDLKSQLGERDDLIRQLISERLTNSQKLIDERLQNISLQNKTTLEMTSKNVGNSLDFMQKNITTVLESIRAENKQQLDNINRTVNEKLERSISKQLTNSHEQIFKNLQVMTEKISQLNTIGTDITRLNKTLSNVKRRGIFGETQLFSIVEDILPKEQYRKNFRTSDNTNESVECAVKLPSNDIVELYMPVDAKFPQDKYIALIDARESLEADAIKTAEKELKDSILNSAKEICKYLGKNISNTNISAKTTDYGIMFLPTESLYAEALALDVVNIAQQDYKIYIVGPTNLSALLTVFKTAHQSLVLQQKTKEVEKILSETKLQFDKFSDALDKVKKNMTTAQTSLDSLIGTRTNSIRRALKNITISDNMENSLVFEHFSKMGEDLE